MTQPDVRETSGSDQRPGREVDEPLARFDLGAELRRLSDEPDGNDAARSTITLAKAGAFRVVLTALKAGATLGGDDTNGSLGVQVLRGSATVSRDDREERVEPEQIVVIGAGSPWRATAETDAVLLLTVCWPEGEDPAFA